MVIEFPPRYRYWRVSGNPSRSVAVSTPVKPVLAALKTKPPAVPEAPESNKLGSDRSPELLLTSSFRMPTSPLKSPPENPVIPDARRSSSSTAARSPSDMEPHAFRINSTSASLTWDVRSHTGTIPAGWSGGAATPNRWARCDPQPASLQASSRTTQSP